MEPQGRDLQSGEGGLGRKEQNPQDSLNQKIGNRGSDHRKRKTRVEESQKGLWSPGRAPREKTWEKGKKTIGRFFQEGT